MRKSPTKPKRERLRDSTSVSLVSIGVKEDSLRIARLKAVLKELDMFSKDGRRDLENNKKAQAAVCLLQLMGLKLGYDDFKYQVIGVHSFKLSHDLHLNFSECRRRDEVT